MIEAIQRIATRAMTTLCKALVKAVDDTTQLQLVKVAVQQGEVPDGIERLQNFGFSSNPPIESEALIGYIYGNRDHGVALVIDCAALRPTGLVTGESIHYSQYGQTIHLKSDGTVTITAPAGVTVGSGTTPVAGSTKVDALWAALQGVCSAFVPPGTPDGGAALSAAIAAAITAVGIGSASTNLRVD